MLRVRPYEDMDASTILFWCEDERAFYKWSAGMLGTYPATREDFGFVKSLIPLTAVDDNGIIGFFTLRKPDASPDELRMGFVILDPEKRGKGYGKEMLRLGLSYAFEICGAKRVSLGVFENNAPAYHCYKAAGFQDVIREKTEIYRIMNEDWKCLELRVERCSILSI